MCPPRSSRLGDGLRRMTRTSASVFSSGTHGGPPSRTLSFPASTADAWSALRHVSLDEGVLIERTHVFARDHVFGNWTQATRIVSGISTYSGAYNWRRLAGSSGQSDTPPLQSA